MKRWLLKFFHNVVTHPLLELPFGWGVPLHDWSAQLAFGHLYYIWWLTQEDLEALELWGLEKSPMGLPRVLEGQVLSALGRSGRGRLWDGLNSGVSVDPWPSTPLADHCSGCAGIVIEAEHMRLIRELPGIVTDTNLRRAGE